MVLFATVTFFSPTCIVVGSSSSLLLLLLPSSSSFSTPFLLLLPPPFFLPPPPPPEEGKNLSFNNQSIVTTSHDPSFLSNLYIIGNGLRHTAEYTNTSESSVTTACVIPSTHNLANCESASYGANIHFTGPCLPHLRCTAAHTTRAISSVDLTHNLYFSSASLRRPIDIN